MIEIFLNNRVNFIVLTQIKECLTSLLTGAAPCCTSNHPQPSMARSPVQQPVRPVS